MLDAYTNEILAGARMLLGKAGLAGYFEGVSLGKQVKGYKPNVLTPLGPAPDWRFPTWCN